jgi:hypothetical protein
VPVGKNSVHFGDEPEDVGDNSVVIRATDALNQMINNSPGGFAMGARANAGQFSVAIGAESGGRGLALAEVLDLLEKSFAASGSADASRAVRDLHAGLASGASKARIQQLWSVVKVAGTTGEAVALVNLAAPVIERALHHLV